MNRFHVDFYRTRGWTEVTAGSVCVWGGGIKPQYLGHYLAPQPKNGDNRT